jgi:hypothetical protein
MKRRAILEVMVASAVLLIPGTSRAAGDERRVTLYKDPSCGCCEAYAAHLRGNRFEVAIVRTSELPDLFEKYGIPAELESCHIAMIDNYLVVGHVPAGVVDRLLSEKPRIAGISLPGMPSGSPGMNGPKMTPFKIYVIGEGAPQLYTVA